MSNDNYKFVPVGIKGLIRSKGLRQDDVAEALHITTSSLSRKLNGKSEFKISELKDLATYLDVSLEYIIAAMENETFVKAEK